MDQFDQRIATDLSWHLEAGNSTGALSISISYAPVSLSVLTGHIHTGIFQGKIKSVPGFENPPVRSSYPTVQ
jgi:hypothetical protein